MFQLDRQKDNNPETCPDDTTDKTYETVSVLRKYHPDGWLPDTGKEHLEVFDTAQNSFGRGLRFRV